MRHQIWIDRGGTFTDCIGLDVDTGELKVIKLLSSQDSVVDGVRKLLGLSAEASFPACEVRMGTTIATNALLERKGCDYLLITSRGFGDVPEIGTQARPDLFALAIDKPKPLHSAVIEVSRAQASCSCTLTRTAQPNKSWEGWFRAGASTTSRCRTRWSRSLACS